MYTKQFKFKDFKGNDRSMNISFNLTEREVIKLLNELKVVFEWRETLRGDYRTLDTTEVVNFYNAFEEILLTAYGIPSEDGLKFAKSGLRYEFEESAAFNAVMMEFVSSPSETTKLIDGIMPKGMEDLVMKADANLQQISQSSTDADLRAEVERLRAQIRTDQQAATS